MTSKRKPVKREVKYLYKKLLKPDGRILNLKNVIGFYDEFNDFVKRVHTSEESPDALKSKFGWSSMSRLEMPLYLKWAKKYLM